MIRKIAALFVLAAVVTLSACGQSGPLYIPGNPSEIRTPAPQPAQGEREENDDEDDG